MSSTRSRSTTTGDAVEDINVPVSLPDHPRQPEHVPVQHRPDNVADQPIVNMRQLLLGHARREGRTTVGRERSSVPTSSAAGVPHRASSDTELPSAGQRGDPDPARRRKVFAGQRDEGFYVDLGSIFDLGALRPFGNLHLLPLPATAEGWDEGLQRALDRPAGPKTDLTRDGTCRPTSWTQVR